MSYLYKEYYHVKDNEYIKISISFNRDRTNWATYQPKKIGYQVNMHPVKRSQSENFTIEESGAFTGFLDCLLEVDRQSKKRLEAAIKVLEERKPMYLKYFGIELEKEQLNLF